MHKLISYDGSTCYRLVTPSQSVIVGSSMRQSAADRFIFRVLAILDERQINQKDLRGSRSEGWISSKLKGHRKLKLNEAEDIAATLQYPLAELLRRPDDLVYELDTTEARLIDGFRQLTRAEQDALLILATLRQRPAPYVTGRTIAKHVSARGSTASSRQSSLPHQVQQIIADADKAIAAFWAGQQAPAARPARPRTAPGDRGTGGSDAEPARRQTVLKDR